METKIRNVILDVASKPGVTGVLIADQNGLCLGSKGSIDSSVSGSLVHLMQLAKKLEPTKSPILKLEADISSIIIKSDDKITLALAMNQKKH
uniref:Late endosomal/lysosomal adaptor and MAPK and MTOR activator 5 n=1 Tax=Parasteatoda tepidariorum TaxID=114398 RepID=A0A2L2Y275_PARTP